MKQYKHIYRPIRACLTAVLLAASVSACATSPMDLLPASARNMIAAEMRLNTSSSAAKEGPISINELLSRARGGATDTPEKTEIPQGSKAPKPEVGFKTDPMPRTAQPQDGFSTALGLEGAGLEGADKTAFKSLLSTLKPGVIYQIRIDVGSSGGRDKHSVVFKTMGDAADLRDEATSVGHIVSGGVDVTLPAGLISIDFTPISGGRDA